MQSFVSLVLFFIVLLENFISLNNLKIDEFLKEKFTASEKLGQILMLNISPQTREEVIKKAIREYKIGNFNLVGFYKDEKILKKQINLIYQEVHENLKLEPFIGVDEEGAIQRLGWLNSIKQKDLKNKEEALKEAFKRGKILKSLGINMIFAPVLDFTTSSDDYIWPRTFENSKEKSIELGKAMIEGFYQAEIFPVAKHFPGYIFLKENPHGNKLENKSFEIYQQSVDVFQKVIEEKLPLGLMIAHLPIKEFGDKPITRSKEFTDYVRRELPFEGLLVTDSLGMASYRLNDSFKESVLETLLAQYNLLILSSNIKVSFEMVDYLLKNLEQKKIQESLDTSFLKVYFIKQSLLKKF